MAPVTPVFVAVAAIPADRWNEDGSSFGTEVLALTVIAPPLVSVTAPEKVVPAMPKLLSPLMTILSFAPVAMFTFPVTALPNRPTLSAPVVKLPATNAFIVTIGDALELASAVMLTLPLPVVVALTPNA